MVIVVMGVSGCGKTTIGRALAARVGAAFVEGDDLHPDANIRKMRAGIPLRDADRWGWLARVRAEIERLLASDRTVVAACSALKRRYREELAGAGEGVVFLYLRVGREEIRERVERRAGSHFMASSLVASQFEALEEPGADEPAITVDADRLGAEGIVGEIVEQLGLGEGRVASKRPTG